MATASGRAGAKRGRKGFRGKLPVKQSINLVLADEKKAPIGKAIPGILAIIVLAGLFSKFLVADRLSAMSRAAARTAQLQRDLEDAYALIDSFGEVEDTYAHYTYADMTADELGLVDRTKVVELVKTILPTENTEKTWSVSGNILTVEIIGKTLEELNTLARKIEEDPIVDSCTITTANKNDKVVTQQRVNNRIVRTTTQEDVWGRFVIYLQKVEEEEGEP